MENATKKKRVLYKMKGRKFSAPTDKICPILQHFVREHGGKGPAAHHRGNVLLLETVHKLIDGL